ncbi:hypothetical protein [Terrihalobacillus insolitus]|uniref:hypothetical protein n=1 Tax=Terrihalobacillus insolitus TaxID=2950438 RepID=UPI0023408E6E|nr:hypothetical protein [Terrihalobacillus insolitus]MDC3412560.1 hypothetical protein [Terrihalobacillus insolitus]
MKFSLEQTAIFEGEEVIVWDYSLRYKEYDIKKQDGIIIHGLAESELKEIS